MVLSNKWEKSMIDVEPMNERIMTMSFRHHPEIMVIGAYAPTADAAEESKGKFYEAMDTLIANNKHNNLLILAGDFNVRLQTGFPGEEQT